MLKLLITFSKELVVGQASLWAKCTGLVYPHSVEMKLICFWKTVQTITPYLLIKLFSCSLNDFRFIKVDFLKAEIILGLNENKTMHQKHITGHIHSSKGIQHYRPDILL